MTPVKLTIHGYDATRWIIAQQSERDWAAAVALLGPSEFGYRRLRLLDRQGKIPEQIVFEKGGGNPDFQKAFGCQSEERNYLKDAHVAYPEGQPSIVAYEFRFESAVGVLERYQPLTEVERANRAVARETKRVEREDKKWREEHPLFADANSKE